MYTFKDILKQKRRKQEHLPVSAMNYDGIFLEEAIEGYRTLSVSGREMISLDFETKERGIGSSIVKQTIPSRVLTIEYMISNSDPESILVNYRRLMEYLYREKEVTIYFNDELDVYYKGRYSASDDVPGNAYSFTSTFEIVCSNPLKFNFNQSISDDGQINTSLPFKVRPTKISVVTEKREGIKISDGKKTISMTKSSFEVGDIVDIIFNDGKGKIYHNGVLKTRLLDLTSDFENFYLYTGQKISCSNGKMTIEYQGVYQ